MCSVQSFVILICGICLVERREGFVPIAPAPPAGASQQYASQSYTPLEQQVSFHTQVGAEQPPYHHRDQHHTTYHCRIIHKREDHHCSGQWDLALDRNNHEFHHYRSLDPICTVICRKCGNGFNDFPQFQVHFNAEGQWLALHTDSVLSQLLVVFDRSLYSSSRTLLGTLLVLTGSMCHLRGVSRLSIRIVHRITSYYGI